MSRPPLVIEIDAGVRKELEYLVELHARYGAPNPVPSVEALVGYVLAAVADGSRRPGAWERQMLEQMGLVADAPSTICGGMESRPSVPVFMRLVSNANSTPEDP
jgi:hypothetical protein